MQQDPRRLRSILIPLIHKSVAVVVLPSSFLVVPVISLHRPPSRRETLCGSRYTGDVASTQVN